MSINKTSIYDILQHLMVLICLVETERSNERYDNDNKQNIRASSIPPPRAVISSPGIFTKPPFFLQVMICIYFYFDGNL